jgi:regulatory protein
LQISDLNEKELTRAKNAAYRLLTYRPRSRVELVQKLRDKEFDEEIIDSVVAGLVRLGYINDTEFAHQWASGRIRLRGFGRRRIEQELRNKGISRELVRETLQDVFGELSEEDVARREADKRLRTLARFDPEVRRRRLAGFLERKGFASDIIRAVLRTVV